MASALRGATIVALAKFIGLSHESLSGYRTGRIKISPKAWRKLETAEIRAGIRYGQVSGRSIQDIPADKNPPSARHSGMVAESSTPYDAETSWQDVEAYVRTLKLTHRGLPPDEVLELLQRSYPLAPEKKT